MYDLTCLICLHHFLPLTLQVNGYFCLDIAFINYDFSFANAKLAMTDQLPLHLDVLKMKNQ